MTASSETAAKVVRWAGRYRRALADYLAQGPDADLAPATRLGGQASRLGLETLDVAKVHAQAAVDLEVPVGSVKATSGWIERADAFFIETLAPIEKQHEPALKAEAEATLQAATLRQHAKALAASEGHLERNVGERKKAEAALRRSQVGLLKTLTKTRRLQAQVRKKTQAHLAAHETGRSAARNHLDDELAQELLAIHLRLLILKRMAQSDHLRLWKEIDEAERIVRKSLATIDRVNRHLRSRHDA